MIMIWKGKRFRRKETRRKVQDTRKFQGTRYKTESFDKQGTRYETQGSFKEQDTRQKVLINKAHLCNSQDLI